MARRYSGPAVPQGDAARIARRMWRDWVRPHRATLAAILALVALVSAMTGLYPILIKGAFDAFSARDATALTLGPLIVIAVTAVKGFSLLGLTVLTQKVSTQVEADLRSALYAHLIDADLAQLSRESAAALTQRFTTDFAFVREALTRLSTVLLREVATVIALVAAMLWIDPVLTLVAAVAIPLVGLPVARIGHKLRRIARSSQEQTGTMASLISESLAGARVAKLFGLEDYMKRRARDSFLEVRRIAMKGVVARGRLDPLLEIGGGLAVAGVLVLIGWRIMDGRSSIGDFTGFVSALLLAAQPFRALGNLNAVVQEALAALTRIFALMDEKPAVREAADAKPLRLAGGKVRFRNVSFRYGDGALALDGVDLTASAGRMTALVGRSGAGKSTMIQLPPRLFDVAEGAVEIDGQDVRTGTLRSLRAAIAVVSQDVVLFDDTVAANIGFGREGADRAAIEAAAKAAAAHDFITRLPEGYDTRIGAGGTSLSGGERQRLAIARAFLKDAPILLLDEATSALDTESERLIQAALADLMRGRTVIVIAHRLSTIRQADLIVVMEGGRIAEQGTHDELIARGAAYARLHRMQFANEGSPASAAAERA